MATDQTVSFCICSSVTDRNEIPTANHVLSRSMSSYQWATTIFNKPDVFDDDPAAKPFMILIYSETKGAVDALMNDCRLTLMRASRPGPMRLFNFIVDTSLIYEHVCMLELDQTNMENRQTCRRFYKRRLLFLMDVAHEIIKPLIQSCVDNPNEFHMPICRCSPKRLEKRWSVVRVARDSMNIELNAAVPHALKSCLKTTRKKSQRSCAFSAPTCGMWTCNDSE
jgi:hypothetical protein